MGRIWRTGLDGEWSFDVAPPKGSKLKEALKEDDPKNQNLKCSGLNVVVFA